jgi:hypothetical protein
MPKQQAKIRVPFHPAMTTDAALVQNRFDLGAKIDFFLFTPCQPDR